MEIVKNIYTSLSIILCILSIFCGFESNDIVILCLSVFVENFCVVSSQNRKGENVNILFMPRFYKMNKYLMSILFIIIGGMPIILQYSLGYKYRIHHLINNIFTIPITLTVFIKYIDKLDKKFGIIKSVNYYNNGAIFHWLSLIVNCCFIFVVSFMKAYKRNPAKLYVGNVVITSDSLNVFFLFLVLFLFFICISYIIIYFGFVIKKSKSYFFKDIFPSAPLTGIVIFYIIWGFMAFYETENRLEGAYYTGVIFFIILIFVLTILLWFKLNTRDGKKLLCYNISLVIILAIYGLIVFYLEKVGCFKANQENENIEYEMIITMVCIIVFVIIFLICFSSKIKDKYMKDKEEDVLSYDASRNTVFNNAAEENVSSETKIDLFDTNVLHESTCYRTFLPTDGKTFSMGSNTYNKGFVIYDDHSLFGEGDGYALFDLQGKYSKMTFDVGRTNEYEKQDVVLRVYLNNKYVEEYSLNVQSPSIPLEIDLNYANNMKLEITGGSRVKYGFSNVILYY